MIRTHTDDDICPGCEKKLIGVHSYLANWFRELKKRHRSAHISDGWRGEAEQLAAYKEGKSNCLFPHSKHNYTIEGKPCSLALDIFQIDEDGIARWSFKWFELIDKQNQATKEPILWGGTYEVSGGKGGKKKGGKDGPHYELILSKLSNDTRMVA